MSINIVNKLISITSYFLAQFIKENLQINLHELAYQELNISKGFKWTILAKGTI